MGYEQWWKTLENMIAELRKNDVAIPAEVMTSLKSAKTMIEIYSADLSRSESLPAIENYLLNVESSVMNLAKEKFGQPFAESWMRKLEDARSEKEPETETVSRFIHGLSKAEHWLRILPSDDIPKGDVEGLADELGLSYKMQKDGYILVHGSEEKIKDFVKKMAEKCRGARKT